MKASVIVPVYNAEKFLKRCVDSIINQTYRNIEVILINDGSKDRSLDICREYAVKDTRIKIISQENKGVAYTRNVGLQNATGEYILYVDSDDWIEADMLENMISYCNGDTDIVMCCSDYAETQDEVHRVSAGIIAQWNNEEQIKEFLRHKCFAGHLWDKLIKRELCAGEKFDPDIGYGEDAQFMWKLVKKSRKLVYIKDVLYHHVIEPTSISNRAFSPVKYDAFKVWNEISGDVEKNYPHLSDMPKRNLLFSYAFTLFEMWRADYEDEKMERKILNELRGNVSFILKSKDESVKFKLFAFAAVIVPKLIKKVI